MQVGSQLKIFETLAVVVLIKIVLKICQSLTLVVQLKSRSKLRQSLAVVVLETVQNSFSV